MDSSVASGAFALGGVTLPIVFGAIGWVYKESRASKSAKVSQTKERLLSLATAINTMAGAAQTLTFAERMRHRAGGTRVMADHMYTEVTKTANDAYTQIQRLRYEVLMHGPDAASAKISDTLDLLTSFFRANSKWQIHGGLPDAQAEEAEQLLQGLRDAADAIILLSPQS